MIRGNVAVVRHGATAPSTQSGAVLLELSPSRMRDSGWDQLPPDVRFAGEALQKMRAPPWIAIYLNQPLTEKPSCEAGHMTAPDVLDAAQLCPYGCADPAVFSYLGGADGKGGRSAVRRKPELGREYRCGSSARREGGGGGHQSPLLPRTCQHDLRAFHGGSRAFCLGGAREGR